MCVSDGEGGGLMDKEAGVQALGSTMSFNLCNETTVRCARVCVCVCKQ